MQYFETLVDFLIGLVLGVVAAFADQAVGPLPLSREIPLGRLYEVAIHRHLSRPEPSYAWESWGGGF